MNAFLKAKRDELAERLTKHVFDPALKDGFVSNSICGFDHAISLLWPVVIAVKEAMPMIEEGYDVTALYAYDSNTQECVLCFPCVDAMKTISYDRGRAQGREEVFTWMLENADYCPVIVPIERIVEWAKNELPAVNKKGQSPFLRLAP